ncbi:unnamed protein product [Soboliphyme baturini]|uniref:Glyco_transf_7N domain-containing protein n=1 Tax=Soboliphyme baturini TaxID=241478 RepID=A0A183J446_9BILA|nr:unnamed protein product [Soboliphyme baturini]
MATCCQRRDRLVYVVDLGAVWPTLAATASYWNVTRVWIGDSVRRMLFCGNGTCNWEDQSSTLNSTCPEDIQRDGMHQEWHPKIVVEHESYARQTVAMIIPYRDRESHLKIFLDHIRPFLRKQNISYQIFVVEQVRNQTFNKGLLTNVGFVFADRIGSFSCFIFHDVDLLPENDRNLYQCDDQPRHFAVAIDKNGYK